jgi:hypothetical protein
MNYTFGYNLGLCLRGKNLNYSPHGGVDVVSNFLGKFYWLNSIEAGVRIPFNNRMLETSVGFGWWENINSGNLETRFPDTLINNIIVNRAILGLKKARKLYIYIAYSKSRNVMPGFELNYCQGYGTEVNYPYVYPNSFVSNVRRDLLGGGVYLKFCNTRKNKKRFRIDPYFIIKIAGSYEVHSNSPYSGLWDKKLTVWYTGLYGGFNLNIGGKI